MDVLGILGLIFSFLVKYVPTVATYVGYVVAAIGTLIPIFMVIPGDQPEKFLQSIVDWIKARSL